MRKRHFVVFLQSARPMYTKAIYMLKAHLATRERDTSLGLCILKQLTSSKFALRHAKETINVSSTSHSSSVDTLNCLIFSSCRPHSCKLLMFHPS